MRDISRRDFLKGSLATAASAAALGLTGIAPPSPMKAHKRNCSFPMPSMKPTPS